MAHSSKILAATTAPKEVNDLLMEKFGDAFEAQMWWETPNPEFLGKLPRQVKKEEVIAVLKKMKAR